MPDYWSNSIVKQGTSQGMGYPGTGGGTIDEIQSQIGMPPTYTAPTYTAPPAYVAPTYDEDRISALEQQKAAPGLRAARSQIEQVQGRYEENPNVKAMTLRQALAGYGLAVEQTMAGAETAAETEYGREYATKSQEAQINYQGATTTAQTQYQGALTAAQATFQGQETQYQDLFANYMKQRYGGPSATPAGTPAAKTPQYGGGAKGVSWAPSDPNAPLQDTWAQYDTWAMNLPGTGGGTGGYSWPSESPTIPSGGDSGGSD